MYLFYLFLMVYQIAFSSASHFLIETEGRQLSTYESYKDVQMLSYDIPYDVKEATWKFYLHRQSDCSSHNISVYIRFGGYPIINPDNATFPPNFITDSMNGHHLEVQLSKTAHIALNISSPKPGKYFAAAFIKRNSNKIRQRGLFSSCKVILSSKLTYDKQDDVEVLLVNRPLLFKVVIQNYFKFMLSDSDDFLAVVIAVQNTTSNSSAKVPFSIAYGYIKLPSLTQSKNVVNCSADYLNNTCTLFILAPGLRNWNYILIKATSDVAMEITLKTSRCTNPLPYDLKSKKPANSSVEGFSKDLQENAFCLRQVASEKITATETFKYSFVMLRLDNSSLHPLTFNISYCRPTLISFYLDSVLDIGGTLNVDVILFSQQENGTYKTSDNVTLYTCLENESIPKIDAYGNCTSKLLVNVSNKTGMLNAASMSLPFPEAGHWYLVFKILCSEEENDSKSHLELNSSCNNKNHSVYFHIHSEMCVKGSCGKYGTCQPFISGGLIFSSCVCTAGWKGWGCTDGSDAMSNTQLLTATLLLTLSNLLFIPAIILAIYRRYFTEALVYFFTMFFSTFYHACDVDVYTFCLMRGSVMQFCDFYASIMSFWVTVIALSDLPEYLRSVSHMAGALGIALGVEYDRTGLWVFVVPFTTAIIIMTISWLRRCKQRKMCYPEKQRWFLGILPGILLAGTGLILFAFFETKENYAYIHSAWHAATALSILVLLPHKKNYQDGQVEEIHWKRSGESFKFLQDNETDML